jgi:hypothetical protein
MVVVVAPEEINPQPRQSSSIYVSVDQGKLAIRASSEPSSNASSKPSKLSFFKNPRRLFSSAKGSGGGSGGNSKAPKGGKSLDQLDVAVDRSPSPVSPRGSKSEAHRNNLHRSTPSLEEAAAIGGGRAPLAELPKEEEEEEEEEGDEETVVSVQEAVAAIEKKAVQVKKNMGNSCSSYTLRHHHPLTPPCGQVSMRKGFKLHVLSN